MTLQEWVRKTGTYQEVGTMLGVSRHAVRWWITRQGRPKIETALYIVKCAQGDLTLDEVFNSTVPVKPRRGSKRG